MAGEAGQGFSITEGDDPMVERKMDGGEIFVEILKQHGVEYIIGSPGSEWPPLWEALSRRRAEGEPAPTYINCRHEGLAVGLRRDTTAPQGSCRR